MNAHAESALSVYTIEFLLMTQTKPVLIIASFEKGRGSGHLVRGGLLARDLRKFGREVMLYLPGLGTGRSLSEARMILAQSLENLDEVSLINDDAELQRDWALVIFDRFSTPLRELERFDAPALGIDEGGRSRRRFDFLLDLLPNLPSLAPPNALRPDLLCLPERRSPAGAAPANFTAPLKILVSFGGEDAAMLGLTAALSCAAPGLSEVTLVGGALNKMQLKNGVAINFAYIPFIKNLREQLADYNLVITHFGLCAFEALYAGVPVILASPTPLHELLAANAGFISAGRGKKGAARLAKLLFISKKRRLNAAFLSMVAEHCAAAARKYNLDADKHETLAAYINNLEPKTSGSCPLCRYKKNTVIARFADRTYRRCARCGIVYMSRNVQPDIHYTEAYFFENYKKQYGKTYLEDFPNLMAMANRRLEIIKTLLDEGGRRARVLDIGCAYGAFLAAARDKNFECAGVDGSAAAVAYVRDELGINAFEGFFPEGGLINEIQKSSWREFDAVTLWYVIEHFETANVAHKSECALETAIQKIHGLLKTGGILAFSTPNSSGISGRLSLKKFMEKSPADHWTIWDYRHVRKILSHFGFKVKKIVVTGHHPERFPFCGKLSSGRFMYKLILIFSKLFRLGDTFEVYAKKLDR
jgi:2-polyprenyl-3-methyl-5-hydroxy-6-metoxy-1,4-benzoquinol methylase/spore coat polysaccharide biosynthesis predicted glycosyltransferase SpsG